MKRLHVLQGIAVFVILAVAGGVLFVVSGSSGGVPAAGQPLDAAAMWLAVPLALAPAGGLIVAYRGVSKPTVEPWGASAERRIGWRIWAGLLVLSSGVTAVALARHEFIWAAVWTVLGPISLALALETERRTRQPLREDAWTDPSLDRLRVHRDAWAVAALWVTVGVALWLLTEPRPGMRPLEYLLAIPWVATIWAYRGVWYFPPPGKRKLRAAVIGYWLSGLFALVVPFPAVRVGYLALGITWIPWLLERARRRAIADRSRALADAGLEHELTVRYGPREGSAGGLNAKQSF